MSLRKRLFAWAFHAFISDHSFYDSATRQIRANLLAQTSGDVLEIGAGDGANLPLYPPDVRLTLLEPNHFLLDYIPAMADRTGCPTCYPVKGVGEYLPFANRQFDAVVSTHVLCSVQDQTRVLSEIRRILRPGGMFVFLEHVAAPTSTGTYRLQRLLEPAWRFVGDNCHLTRDTGTAIQQAGFSQVAIETFRADYPAFVSPHVMGTARN